MFNLFRKQKSEEVVSTQVFLDNDLLYYEDHGNLASVSLNFLSYAYVSFLGGNGYLYLFDSQQHYISINQKGFTTVYRLLTDRFGFDDEIFFNISNGNVDKKARIWIRKELKNYTILDGNYNDFKNGYEVCSEPPYFVSWDSTYDDLIESGYGKLHISELGSPYFTFGYPIRVGALVLNQLEFYADNDRKDIAVQSYFTCINNGENNDGSYEELRSYWLKTIFTDLEEAGYEREDQKHLCFDLGGVYFSICYTYDEELGYDDGSTSISITNCRDYAAELLLERNDLNSDNTTVLTFNCRVEFNPSFKDNAKVTARPSFIDQIAGSNPACFLNRVTERIGFSSDRYAIEFDRNAVESVVIQMFFLLRVADMRS